MSAHDWGPAFAEQNPEILKARMESLRDYFAAQIVVAAYRNHMDGTRNVDRDAAALASECYAVADAMLRARAEKGVGT